MEMPKLWRSHPFGGGFLLMAMLLSHFVAPLPAQSRVEVTYPAQSGAATLNGRVFLYFARLPAGAHAADQAVQPRLLINDHPGTGQFFGVDATAWKPGTPIVFDASVFGYPLSRLSQLRPGTYVVQALFNRYALYVRADGHTLLLPPDRGEGQDMQRKPGNLYSRPQTIHFDPASSTTLRLSLSESIPPIILPADTRWIKHVRIESHRLSQFWGQPVYLSAMVVLPDGFASHPDAHYPLMLEQNHFVANLRGAFDRNRQAWTSGKLPKFLWVVIHTPNPYYDDSYAVNSANLGPYGDAIMQELIPAVEKRFRGIGRGWARVTYGCSTGGWEALADQIFYPDEFNGAWGSSPDPVDFRSFQIVNLYQDHSAFWLEGPFSRVPRPDARTPDGSIWQTMDRDVHRELVLGTHGRSADQWDAWQAVFSPVGPDGYPAEIWDPMTGVIHHSVAQYWHDHYDLDAWLDAHWSTLAPRLDGKLHVYVGDMDTYYLDNAVYRMQATIEAHHDPSIRARFVYGRKQPHCFDGTYGQTTEEQLYMPQMLERLLKTAPPGADLSWRYSR